MTEMEKNVKGNKGFSLITVIITVAFIGILGLLVLYLALQNFNMKITGIKGKDSFYTAEQALEEIRLGLPISKLWKTITNKAVHRMKCWMN